MPIWLQSRLLITLLLVTLITLSAISIISISIVVSAAGKTRSVCSETPGVPTGGDDQAINRTTPCDDDEKRALASSPANGSSLLYECELSYMQMDISLIKFSINYLELTTETQTQRGDGQEPGEESKDNKANFRLPKIEFDDDEKDGVTSTHEINDTWMFGVAQNFALRKQSQSRQQPQRNVVFLTWGIPNLFANNLLSMIPAYYKTVANYDLILGCVTRALVKFIEFVDETRNFSSAATGARLNYYKQWHFYGHSLGSHILSDAISRVVISKSSVVDVGGITQLVGLSQQVRPLKFGKLVGLDPATPCFVSREYGISSSKVARAVHEVLVLHSNAGFAGIPNERANLEIVLNGGTFQPGCAWYDFTCHHVRSTDILSYTDDTCQMVAYKCTSYHHFKLGACETCDAEDEWVVSRARPLPERNCVLVNLPEQHEDSRAVLEYAEQFSDDERRQLGQEPSHYYVSRDDRTSTVELFKRLYDDLTRRQRDEEQEELHKNKSSLTHEVEAQRADLAPVNLTGSKASGRQGGSNKANRKSYYHFVSTSPNFRFGRKTHCLQHYQLRLLIYSNNSGGSGDSVEAHNNSSQETSGNLREKCKLSAFYISSSDEIKLKLFHEQPEPMRGGGERTLESKLVLDGEDARQMSSSIKLSAVIKDLFHTTLVNFEGAPRLFTGAELDNIDLGALGECLMRESAPHISASNETVNLNHTPVSLNFVLDIAFMSHTNSKIRHAYSSVLCGQLDSLPTRRRAVARSSASGLSQNKSSDQDEEDDQGGQGQQQQQQETSTLMLKLCKRSDLTDVSSQIDRMLAHMRLHRLDETWKVSLLNSLFSLFTEWEPF